MPEREDEQVPLKERDEAEREAEDGDDEEEELKKEFEKTYERDGETTRVSVKMTCYVTTC